MMLPTSAKKQNLQYRNGRTAGKDDRIIKRERAE